MAELIRATRIGRSGICTVLLLVLISIPPASGGPTIYHNMVVSSTTTTTNLRNEVLLGSQLNMTCEYKDIIHDYGMPSITWSKKNNCLRSVGTETIYTSSGQGTSVLGGFSVHPETLSISAGSTSGSIHMSEASVFDSSCYSFTYLCQVQSYEGISVEYTKHVYNASLEISLTDPARIVSITEDVVVREKQDVTLSCLSTGIPAPEVTWSKSDGSPLPANIGGGPSYQPDDKSGTLHLPTVTKDASGTYSCSAVNRIVSGPIVKSVRVQVEYAPHIQVRSLRVSQKLGYHTELSCQVEANPDNITAIWYYLSKDPTSASAQADTKYKISIEDEEDRRRVMLHTSENNVTMGSTLVITDVTSVDYKIHYCCQFTNGIGSTSRCIDVLESNVPVRVNGKKPKRGQSANHSDTTATFSHALTFLTVMLTSLFMVY